MLLPPAFGLDLAWKCIITAAEREVMRRKKDGLGFLESKKTFLRVFFFSIITCVYKPNQLALIHIVVG